MAQVIVRNLDRATVDALKARAAAQGRSLEQELRLLLASAAVPSREQVVEIAAAIRGLSSRPVTVNLEALIGEDRER